LPSRLSFQDAVLGDSSRQTPIRLRAGGEGRSPWVEASSTEPIRAAINRLVLMLSMSGATRSMVLRRNVCAEYGAGSDLGGRVYPASASSSSFNVSNWTSSRVSRIFSGGEDWSPLRSNSRISAKPTAARRTVSPAADSADWYLFHAAALALDGSGEGAPLWKSFDCMRVKNSVYRRRYRPLWSAVERAWAQARSVAVAEASSEGS